MSERPEVALSSGLRRAETLALPGTACGDCAGLASDEAHIEIKGEAVLRKQA